MDYKFTIMPVSEADGGGYFAEVPELPGCVAAADTLEETMALLEEAVDSWIMVTKEKGKKVPQPTFYSEDKLPSGRFSVRLARSIHKQLLDLAEYEHESLNCTVTRLLEQGLMLRSVEQTLKEMAYKNYPEPAVVNKKGFTYPTAAQCLLKYGVCEEQEPYGKK